MSEHDTDNPTDYDDAHDYLTTDDWAEIMRYQRSL